MLATFSRWHSPKLSASVRPPSAIVSGFPSDSAAIVAYILEGENGRLGQGLAAGRIANLDAGLADSSAAERREFQARAGGDLDCLREISREPDAELFFASLLNLARHLEGRASPELLGRLYGSLAQVEGAAPAVTRQARERLATLRGEGTFGLQAEQWLSQLASEAASPAMILGMTAGSLAYRAGRLVGLRGLLNLGLRGRSLSAFAAGAGLMMETAAFLGASKGVRGLSGGHEDWSSTNLRQQYLGTLWMLGALRVSDFVAVSLRPELPSAARWARIPERGYRQVAMFAGLVGSHLGAMQWGWESRKSVSQVLGTALGEWASFQIGGAVAQRLLGHYLTPLESRLEAAARRLEINGKPGLITGILSPTAPLRAGSPVGGGGSVAKFIPHIVLSIGGDSGNGSGGPKPPLASDSGLRRESPSMMEMIPPGKNYRVSSALSLMTKLQIFHSPILARLQTGDLEIAVEGQFKVPDSQLRLLQVLNNLTRKNRNGGTPDPIPLGTRLTLVLQAGSHRVEARTIAFIYTAEGFKLTEVDEATPTPIHEEMPPPDPEERLSSPPGLVAKILGSVEVDANANHISAFDFFQLNRWILENPRLFGERLISGHLNVQLKSELGFQAEMFRTLLNQMPRLAEIEAQRRVDLAVKTKVGWDTMAFVKFSDGFAGPLTSFRAPPRGATRGSEHSAGRHRGTVTLPPPVVQPAMGDASFPPPSGNLFHQLQESMLDTLPLQLKRVARESRMGQELPDVILVPQFPGRPSTPLDAETLNHLTDSLLEADAATNFRLLVPGSLQSFSARPDRGRLVWSPETAEAWRRGVESGAPSQEFATLRGLYQYLVGLGRNLRRTEGTENTLRFEGHLLYSRRSEFLDLVLKTLNQYRVVGKQLDLSLAPRQPAHQFGRQNKVWVYRGEIP